MFVYVIACALDLASKKKLIKFKNPNVSLYWVFSVLINSNLSIIILLKFCKKVIKIL